MNPNVEQGIIDFNEQLGGAIHAGSAGISQIGYVISQVISHVNNFFANFF